jgi:hypothetical protein
MLNLTESQQLQINKIIKTHSGNDEQLLLELKRFCYSIQLDLEYDPAYTAWNIYKEVKS